MIQLNVQIVFEQEYKGLTFRDAIYIYSDKANWETMSNSEVEQDVAARIQGWSGMLNGTSVIDTVRAEVDSRFNAWKQSIDNPTPVVIEEE